MVAWRGVALLLGVFPLLGQQDGPAFFETNIRPMLVKQCLGCHSAASQPVMGGLRLDTRELAIKGGSRGAAIVPGKPERKPAFESRFATPPARCACPRARNEGCRCRASREWIQMGAPWGSATTEATKPTQQKFWAFVPPIQPTVPAVKDKGWVRSPIDAFVLAALEAKGLTPAKPADKRTLIRRASYDLTGLPPTPTEVQAFLADNSPNAFARWSIDSWHPRDTANVGDGTGWTSLDMPTRTGWTRTWSTGMHSGTATTSSQRSTRTSHSTSSSRNNSPAIFCRRPMMRSLQYERLDRDRIP